MAGGTKENPVKGVSLDLSAPDLCNRGSRGSKAAKVVLQKLASLGWYATSVLQGQSGEHDLPDDPRFLRRGFRRSGDGRIGFTKTDCSGADDFRVYYNTIWKCMEIWAQQRWIEM